MEFTRCEWHCGQTVVVFRDEADVYDVDGGHCLSDGVILCEDCANEWAKSARGAA